MGSSEEIKVAMNSIGKAMISATEATIYNYLPGQKETIRSSR